MKFRIACDDFAQTLGRLQGFLSRKPLSEVLSNVLLEVDSKGILCLSATDELSPKHELCALKHPFPSPPHAS